MKHIKRLVALVMTLALTVSMLAVSGLSVNALDGAGYGGTKHMIDGIDLSYWNVGGPTLNYSLVDFDKLVASGCKFAILRIGLGSSSNSCSMDKAFLEYYKRARAAGMELGCYFYSHALTYTQAANEAKWVINVIESNNMYFEYPIYTDMEESDQTALSSSSFTNVALGFCETMVAAGYFPAMYGAHSSMSKLTTSFCNTYDRWTAKVKANETTSNRFSKTTYDYSASFGMWQYTWMGQKMFSGIGANMLDVNICYKDYPSIMKQYGYNNVGGGGSTADKIGTYRINSNAPTTDPLNVRSGAGTSYDIVDTVIEGDIVNVTALSGNWGKFVTPNGKEGWASVKNNADYIGIDAQAGTSGAAWGTFDTSVNDKGSMTLVNQSAERAAYDFKLPLKIGTNTTPYFSIMITPNSGSGYFFGLTEEGSGYWMLRDCTSGDQLVNADTAPYMTGTEQLEINMKDWWKPADGQRINMVRLYLAPNTSVTVNYMYFAEKSGAVTDERYNLLTETEERLNTNLMTSDLSITHTDRTGGYTYNKGVLTVTSESDSGYAVSFNVDKTIAPATLHRLLFSVASDVRYDIRMTVTASDGKRIVGLVADFWPGLCTSLDGNYLPAKNQTAGLDLKSVYDWNNVMPADGNSTVKTVTVLLGGKGTLELSAFQVANSDNLVYYTDDVTKSDSSTGTSDTPIQPDVPSQPDEPITKGDVDNDGTVSTIDARYILLYTVDMEYMDAKQLLAADVNGDGLVSTIDAREILMGLVA